MANFKQPATEAEVIAHAVCGAYLMVAFSDGRYEKSEEIRLVVGLIEKNAPMSMARAELKAALPAMQKAFAADYDSAAARVLEFVRSVGGNGIASRAIMHAARVAVVADRAILVQEEHAMDRLSEALGLKKGAL